MNKHSIRTYALLTLLGAFELTAGWMLLNLDFCHRDPISQMRSPFGRHGVAQAQPSKRSSTGCTLCRLCPVKDGSCRLGLYY